MRWRGRERSQNVEDRRGGRPIGRAVGGGGLLVIIVAGIALLMGADPRAIVGLLGSATQTASQPAGPGVEDSSREFIEVVLRDTETVWARLFQEHVRGVGYRAPRLIIFSGGVRSQCGMASAAMGPFYCPADEQVYIDPTFFDELSRRHQAPGDFAQAYVIAHEVAHHVQLLLGFHDTVNRARQSGDERASNRASVRLELQADYLAGVWAHHAQKHYEILEPGDIEEAIHAANQIGDDTLQRLSQGCVVPERYTHGTSAQRVRWFRAGFTSGDFDACRQLFELEYAQL